MLLLLLLKVHSYSVTYDISEYNTINFVDKWQGKETVLRAKIKTPKSNSSLYIENDSFDFSTSTMFDASCKPMAAAGCIVNTCGFTRFRRLS